MGEKRSQLYVKRHFQQSMILEVLLITFILINIIVMVGYLMIDSIANIQQLKEYLAYSVAGLEIMGFLLVYRYNLKASHRIAGPIFTTERCLKSIESGDLAFAMKLRKKDQFHELGEQMNTTVDQLRERIDKAQELAKQLQEMPGTDSLIINQLVQELSYFKTEPALSKDGEPKQ